MEDAHAPRTADTAKPDAERLQQPHPPGPGAARRESGPGRTAALRTAAPGAGDLRRPAVSRALRPTRTPAVQRARSAGLQPQPAGSTAGLLLAGPGRYAPGVPGR